MAITVNIFYRSTPEKVKAFVHDMHALGIVDKIRMEEGNLAYHYYWDSEDPGCVLLVDAWYDQKAIDKHHATPMMAEISALREKYDLHMEVKRYKDDTSMPSHDEQFIRH